MVIFIAVTTSHVTGCHIEVYSAKKSIIIERLSCILFYTGGIKKFLAKENFQKILKVSHFYLGFLVTQNNNEIKHSQRVSLDFFSPNGENSNLIPYEPENSEKILWE